MLLEKGGDVNAKNNGGWTALHLASQDGYKKIVEMLLEKGADVNAKTNTGWTALKLASQEGHTEIVEMLEEAIANNTENNSSEETQDETQDETQEETQEEKDTKLLEAAQHNNLDKVEAALAAGADVNAKTNEGRTALIMASKYGHTEIVVMLLAAGADVNIKGDYGWTALKKASYYGHADIVKLLKKAMRINEENFIVDKFCKEATYFDPMEGGDVTKAIKKYLDEDKDNMMLIYKSNKADTDLEYFGTTRSIITKQYKDEHNLFYGCNKVITPPPFVPRKEDYNKNDVYFKLSKIGLVGTSSEYCHIKTLLENEEHQLFAIKNLDKKYPSFVAKHVLGDDPNVVSGSHCQGGDAASVSTLIKAYPKNDEFPEISNSNMLQETIVLPLPPPVTALPIPPFPPTTQDSDESDQDLAFGGKRKSKRTKRKSKRTKRKNKRKTKRKSRRK